MCTTECVCVCGGGGVCVCGGECVCVGGVCVWGGGGGGWVRECVCVRMRECEFLSTM